jgi:cobalt-zinc-cadmium efflux system membrane fusion protein
VAVPNPQLRVVAAPQAGVIEALLVAEGERVRARAGAGTLRSPELVDTQSSYLEAVTRLAGRESARPRPQAAQRGRHRRASAAGEPGAQRELSTMVDQRRQLLQLSGFSAPTSTR